MKQGFSNMKTFAFLFAVIAVSAPFIHCSILESEQVSEDVNVGLTNDIPQHVMEELYTHIDEFLEELRAGPDNETLHSLFNFKIEKELEALIALQHYFENPTTSVLAEKILQDCELDMDNCRLLDHLPKEEEDTETEESGNRRLQQTEKYTPGNPDTKFLNLPVAPKNFGVVSRFQFYRDLYCTPPTVNPAAFDFVGSTSFTGVVYAFAILGGSATWNPATQELSVTKPQVVYSKKPANVAKGGSTTKGSATDKSCDFSAAVQIKGKVPGYTKILGIEQQYFKPPSNAPIFIDAKRPSTWPSLRGWFACWINPNANGCNPPTFALSPLLLQLPIQILQLIPGLAGFSFFG